MTKLMFVLLAALLLSGCGSKDAEYYTNHPEEMKQKWEKCSKMSSVEVLADKECAAVNKADSERFFGDKIQRPLQGQGKGRSTKQF